MEPDERVVSIAAGLGRALAQFCLAIESECGAEWKPAIKDAAIVNVETGETFQFHIGLQQAGEVPNEKLN